MGVGGQRHGPAALPPGKTWYPSYRRLSTPQGQSGLPPCRFLLFEVILQYICLLVNVTFTIGRPIVHYSNLHDPPHVSLNVTNFLHICDSTETIAHIGY